MATFQIFVLAVRSEPCPADVRGTECSGNGVCEDGSCRCGYGFGGESCQERICVHDCAHGVCVSGNCVCETGYYGFSCESKVMCPTPPESVPHLVAELTSESGSGKSRAREIWICGTVCRMLHIPLVRTSVTVLEILIGIIEIYIFILTV